MSKSSTLFPSCRARCRAIEPAHLTSPAQSAPLKPPVWASAAKSAIRCPDKDRLTDRPKDLSDDKRLRFPSCLSLTPSIAWHNGLLSRPLRRSASKCIWKISLLPSRSGSGILTCTSSRPGLRRASSSNSRRLVIPITKTLGMALIPSSLASIWLTTLALVASPESSAAVRLRKTASISSITTTCSMLLEASPPHAFSSISASSNRDRTNFSDDPTQRSSNSGADTILGGLACNAFDISLASIVLPHPGGP
mmetsp:Transcript_5530/g.12062  ORF Transcript_5530/g.12062 Transcript_5530/m.12062 type:complete len:251 (+) Transcript_5530:97-849(+)